MNPKDRKELRKLVKVLKQPNAVKRMTQALLRQRAFDLGETIEGRLNSSGNEALAKKIEYVFSDDGQFGIAVLPKHDKMGVADFTESQAIWFVPSRSRSAESRIVSAAARYNPWYGPAVPFLPMSGEGTVIVREVRSGEARKLKVVSEKRAPEIHAMMTAEGVRRSASVKIRVHVDVGFSGLRAEFGGNDSGESIGIWRKAIRRIEDGLPDGCVSRIENVLFAGKGWHLTKSAKGRKIEPDEEGLVQEFQTMI